jgi:uncharacterized protein (DUF2267 family)
MLYEEFLQPVRDSVDGDAEAAEQAVRATLQTLAERIGKDEALHVVPALPPQVAPWLYATGPAQGFDAAGFVERVARREGTPAEVAERHATAVLAALGQALDDEAYRHLIARLPKTFAPLLPRGEFAGAVDPDARHAGDVDGAVQPAVHMHGTIHTALSDTLGPQWAQGLLSDNVYAGCGTRRCSTWRGGGLSNSSSWTPNGCPTVQRR